MPTTDIERDIRGFLVDTFLFGRSEELRDDAPLMDKVIDSHGVVELVVFLQERFAIRVEDEEVTTDNLDSVDKAAAYVARKLASKAQPRTQ
jgi:acyl carrier protein